MGKNRNKREKNILVKPENKPKKQKPQKKNLEMRGIDPRASRMLSERSTI
jgi:hypothetical protein